MDDLVAWLRARYDEREAAARSAPGPDWEQRQIRARHDASVVFENYVAVVDPDRDRVVLSDVPEDVLPFVLANDPAYVLADIAAKRQLIDDHAGPQESPYVADYCEADGWCRNPDDSDLRERMPCRYVRLLAAPFAGHPDFDPAWAVDAT